MKFITVSILILLSSLVLAQEESASVENADTTLVDQQSGNLDNAVEGELLDEAELDRDVVEEEGAPDESEALEDGVESELTEPVELAETDDLPKQEVQEPAPVQSKPRSGVDVVNLSDTIVGNQEQPTVLYIVPWKEAQDTTILYLPLSSKAIENIFGHVERLEHQRQVQYIDQLDKQ